MIEGNCKWCGEPFTTSYERTKYCSPICKGRDHASQREQRPRRPAVRLYCDYCGEPFQTRRPKTQKFCSVEHRRAFNAVVDASGRAVMRAVRESVREIVRARQSINRGA